MRGVIPPRCPVSELSLQATVLDSFELDQPSWRFYLIIVTSETPSLGGCNGLDLCELTSSGRLDGN